MNELTKDEIIELAKEINIGIKDEELDWIVRKLNDACAKTNFLEYIDTFDDRINHSVNTLNKLREDIPNKYDDEQILSCSENKEGNLIVIKL